MRYPLVEDTFGQEEKSAMIRVLESGQYTMGPCVQAIEGMFAAKIQKRHALMVNSGSSANLLGVAALFYKKHNPLRRGDEVIVPAISWCTTYYPLQQYGLKVKFVDVDLHTLNMSVYDVLNAITPCTRMIVAVNILGNPCELQDLREVCWSKDIYLFEDNCESMGAYVNGKQAGAFGDIGTFSTFFSHHISTIEGGFLVTDSEELYHLAKSMRAHGWTRDLPKNSRVYQKSDDDDFEEYRFILPGYNLRPMELTAAAGIEQLKKLDQGIAIRRENAERIQALFRGDDRFILQRENGKSSWFSFTVILNPAYPVNRKKVWKGLREAGIGFRLITGGNFTQHPVIRYFDYEMADDLPNAKIAHEYGFFVGNFPRDLSAELKYFHDVLVKLVE
jgi:CDP-6-deoxy-D-xylo-4-hexulose-3-dehydrase